MRVRHLRSIILSVAAAVGATACAGRSISRQGSTGADAADPATIPTRYDEHRYYIAPVTTGGDTLGFILDSGLDGNFLSIDLAARLHLSREPLVHGRDTLWRARLPALSPNASIPAPDPAGELGGRLIEMPLVGQGLLIARRGDAGVLGSPWLAGRAWTLDYPGHRLLLHPPGSTLPGIPSEHRVPLGFAVDAAGRRSSGFPRLRVLVDGDSLDMLFDTGATMNLSDSALAVLGDGRPARRAGSFVVASIFYRWRHDHPTWRVIERAEVPTGYSMIEVPEMEIGGYHVGPVWFTVRRDAEFHQVMDHLMDRSIVGSLGGSSRQYFAVTLDYPHAIAFFARP